MTVNEAIELVNRLKPNKFTNEDKVKWLSDIDGMIVRELFNTHESSPLSGEFEGYSTENMSAKLLVEFPHDVLYRWYLESQIDLGNAEIAKYNNSKTLFNNAYLTYTDYYNRTHMPKSVCRNMRFTEARKGGAQDALSS